MVSPQSRTGVRFVIQLILIRSRARAPVETSGVTVAFYQALKATGSPVLKAAYHPWIRGKENIPRRGTRYPRVQPQRRVGLRLPADDA